jgi:hypothetical protein
MSQLDAKSLVHISGTRGRTSLNSYLVPRIHFATLTHLIPTYVGINQTHAGDVY